MASGLTRVNDISIGYCSVGDDCCPHQWTSVHVKGSSNVIANNLQAMRAPGDIGISDCPHCPVSFSVTGSSTVKINNLSAHRINDIHMVSCGTGTVVTGSLNIMVGG